MAAASRSCAASPSSGTLDAFPESALDLCVAIEPPDASHQKLAECGSPALAPASIRPAKRHCLTTLS